MKKINAIIIAIVIALCGNLYSTDTKDKQFTIIHTNDLHSHLLGFSPNMDYTPHKTGDDNTRGGWARISTAIKKIRSERSNPVLIFDGGDFLMGSLFHMVCRDEAIELSLLKEMGYIAAALGNHEFDLRPDGLARIINSAHRKNMLPELLISNMSFSKDSPEDDTLEEVFKKKLIKKYIVIERDGVKFGIFAVIGTEAAGFSPFAKPLTFEDPLKISKEMVTILREKEKVDIVVCLSHSGLYMDKSKSEDELLAEEVSGIDIIVSGHSHTAITKPIITNNTMIVQAGEYGKNLGVLDFTFRKGTVQEADYHLMKIDDSIKGDPVITGKIEKYKGLVDRTVLKEQGLTFDKVIAETDFDIIIEEDESNLGNLVTDAMKWYVNKHDSREDDPSSKVVIAVESSTLIRDPILKGKTGKISVSDLFRSIPLGIGKDGSMAYPILSIYIYPFEIKRAMEVITSIYPMKGWDYFVQISGVQFTYNPNRVIFDRVTDIRIGDEENGYQPLDYSKSNKKLYRIVANMYVATFLKVIGSYTMDFLKIIPKDKKGNPIEIITDACVDLDKSKAGIQEAKEWTAVMKYVQAFKDTDGDGIPNVPDKYKGKTGRIVKAASWNPVSLLSGGTWITWTVFFLICAILSLTGFLSYKLILKIRS